MDDIGRLRPRSRRAGSGITLGCESVPATRQGSSPRFCEAGADIILGSHPHVIQTMEIILKEIATVS